MFDDTSYTLRFPRKAALLSVLVAAVAVDGYNTESAERRRHKQQQNSNGGRRGGGGRRRRRRQQRQWKAWTLLCLREQ